MTLSSKKPLYCMLPTRSCFVCKLDGRTRLIVNLQSDDKLSWGEAAPLFPWSKESIEDIAKQMITLGSPFAPSLQFALLSALGNLQNPFFQPPPIPCAYFLNGSIKEIGLQAEHALQNGCTTAKIKISNIPFEEALYIVRQLKDHLRLRIDVNRAWDLDTALSFFSHFAQDAFDFVEEPVSNPSDLEFFTHPFALDESLREGFFMNNPLLKALIIKPSLHDNWIKWLGCGKEIILGSAYESDLGHAHIALLALRLGLTKQPLGLGTFIHLKETLLEEPLNLIKGHLILPSNLGIKRELLHALPLPH